MFFNFSLRFFKIFADTILSRENVFHMVKNDFKKYTVEINVRTVFKK